MGLIHEGAYFPEFYGNLNAGHIFEVISAHAFFSFFSLVELVRMVRVCGISFQICVTLGLALEKKLLKSYQRENRRFEKKKQEMG